MPLTLVEMNAGDFARRRAPLITSYAEAITTTRGLTVAEAEAVAERDVATQLPRGVETRGQLLRKALVDGTEVGWIWVSLPGTTVPGLAWISDVEVDPPFRGRGYAGAIITAVETELIGRNVPGVGLNVFGDNDTARRLYARLDYRVTARQYCRALTHAPAGDRAGVPAGERVELVPMADYESRIGAVVAGYAQDLVQEQGLWHGEAEARAARKVGELLPRGARTEGMLLRTVTAAGVPVGWVWAGPPAPAQPGVGWLHAIEIDAPFRSRGYGSAAVAAVEAELARRGARRVGLNVPGPNAGACRLCERLGYRLLAQQMAKDLPS